MASDTGTSEDRVNPRTVRVQQLILNTAIEVLLEQGAPEVTAHRVAERCEVARTTIYRYWPDQKTLLLATIDAMTAPHAATPSVDGLGDSLKLVLTLLRKRLDHRNVRSVFGAIAGHSSSDETFAAAQRRFVEQLTQPTVDCLAAAVARGELESDLDINLEAALLAGPIFHQHLFLFGEVTDRLIDQTVARWLDAHDLS